jgi:chorismate synthase
MRYLSGGESHGPCLTAVIEGLPAGLPLTADYINHQLKRRQQGYGRGGRMKIESDRVEFLSGIRFGETLGSPVTIMIKNRDAGNWSEIMASEGEKPQGLEKLSCPRPGHADYAGGVKYMRSDFRDILERSSARETAARVAAGSAARRLLEEIGVSVYSRVVSIGSIACASDELDYNHVGFITDTCAYEKIEASPLRCGDPDAEARMRAEIDSAAEKGDTLGGVFEIIVTGVPPGLGSHVQWDRKLDGRIAGALMSLQGIKGVEIGAGFGAASLPGSEVHDAFCFLPSGETGRASNRAGGIEGGISNGSPIMARAAMKPIPTLMNPLPSIDFSTAKEAMAAVERSDVCAVPAASVTAEAIVAWELASAVLDKFSRDSMLELKASLHSYLEMIKRYPEKN